MQLTFGTILKPCLVQLVIIPCEIAANKSLIFNALLLFAYSCKVLSK